MLKNVLFIVLGFLCLTLSAQNVTTFAGKAGIASGPVSTVTLANAKLYEPNGLVFDGSGHLYIAEQGGHRIMMYNPADGNMYVRAGSTADPANGMNANYINQPGTNARFNTPMGMVVNANGDLFVADMMNHCIRKINKFVSAGSAQGVSTYAGEGQNGNSIGDYVNGQGTNARFNSPTDIAIDASGVMYVADAFNDCIRKIDASGNVTLLAGMPGNPGFADGAAASAKFDLPVAVELESATSLLVADANNHRIRRINLTTLQVSTVAGTGANGGDDGAALTTAKFSTPNGLAVDNFGNIFISDGRNGQGNNIRLYNPNTGMVTTIAGKYGENGTTDGPGSTARFDGVGHLVFNDTKDELYVADVNNHTVRKIDLKPSADFNTVTTTINVNVEITMNNMSTGATSYKWVVTPSTGVTFTSGTGDTSKNPKLKFANSGSYTMKLTATNLYGNAVQEKIGYINVSNTGGGNAPIADFSLNRTKVSPKDTVNFIDNSTNNPTVWEWTITPSTANYVSGTGSASQNPRLLFPTPGIYTISLKATNGLGSNTKTRANYLFVFPLGIKEITLDELVNVYPNPTNTGKVTVDLGTIPVQVALTVAVFDITGRTIYRQTHTENPGKIEVNLDNQPKGLYFVTVFDGTNKASKTVVVE